MRTRPLVNSFGLPTDGREFHGNRTILGGPPPCPEEAGEEVHRECNREVGTSKPPLLQYQSKKWRQRALFLTLHTFGAGVRPSCLPAHGFREECEVQAQERRIPTGLLQQCLRVGRQRGDIFRAHNLQHSRLRRTLLQRSSRLQKRCNSCLTGTSHCSGSP